MAEDRRVSDMSCRHNQEAVRDARVVGRKVEVGEVRVVVVRVDRKRAVHRQCHPSSSFPPPLLFHAIKCWERRKTSKNASGAWNAHMQQWHG